MLKRIQTAIVAAAMGAGALALASPAAAVAAPTVSAVEVTPAQVVVSGAPVTASFGFTTANGPENVELQLKPPGIGVGSPLTLTSKDLGDGKKAWSASKTFDRASATGTWTLLAVASGKDGSDSKSASFTVTRQRDSQIVGFEADPRAVRKGGTVSLSGKLLVQDGRGWDGLPGQRVSIQFKADRSYRWHDVTSDVTGRDGRFWTRVSAKWSGLWRAEYAGGDGIKGSISRPDHVRVVRPAPEPPQPAERAHSRIVKFDAFREPVRRGHTLRFAGVLQVKDGWSWDGYRAKVRLYFKADGSRKWRHVKSTWSNYGGRFYTKSRAWKSGQWKAVFTGDEDAYGSSSYRDHVRVKR
ncbi:hypothetical protein [Spongiactinospora sp. TRM90649]|uniref:hypothetical protein n=1 Tax=Spongiactinospora sp. TRM90649 TaxID=3031114 RepID=UPI0023F8ADB0|nr:hypothetical protein [Spongiactinospora sp. TRM90649]MDF5752328.1 hypothetical protein [Spongiactinospora sp. TRM90649]